MGCDASTASATRQKKSDTKKGGSIGGTGEMDRGVSSVGYSRTTIAVESFECRETEGTDAEPP